MEKARCPRQLWFCFSTVALRLSILRAGCFGQARPPALGISAFATRPRPPSHGILCKAPTGGTRGLHAQPARAVGPGPGGAAGPGPRVGACKFLVALMFGAPAEARHAQLNQGYKD